MVHLILLNQDHELMHEQFLPSAAYLYYTSRFLYDEHHADPRNQVHALLLHLLLLWSYRVI